MTILPHALEQYLRRSKTKAEHSVRAMEFLFNAAENGLRLPGHKRYHKGWVIVVRNNQIITAYKPHSKVVQKEIFHACQRRKTKE